MKKTLKKKATLDDVVKRLDTIIGLLHVAPVCSSVVKSAESKASNIVNLDAEPFVPEGWKVEEHKKGGMLDFDASKVALYLSKRQEGIGRIEGNKLREELKAQPVLNANLLDWLLKPENQHLIPKEWEGRAVFFWGTIYRHPDGDLYVRYLFWGVGGWRWGYFWLGFGWRSDNPAVVSAS